MCVCVVLMLLIDSASVIAQIWMIELQSVFIWFPVIIWLHTSQLFARASVIEWLVKVVIELSLTIQYAIDSIVLQRRYTLHIGIYRP